MPIYEYQCRSCQERFEELVAANGAGTSPACPACGSPQAMRMLSVFAVKGSPEATGGAAPASGGGCCGGACGCG